MDSSKHTAGEWYVTGKSDVNGDHLHIGSPESMMTLASMNAHHVQTKANAEFIVRACNAHDALVTALTGLIAMCERQDFNDDGDGAMLERCRTALAAAQ